MRCDLPNVLVLVLGAVASSTLAAIAPAAEVKYFRSDAGVASSADSLPDTLEAPDALCWRVPLDGGHSTPILHAGKIFLTTYRTASRELATVALEEKTGRLLWRSALV